MCLGKGTVSGPPCCSRVCVESAAGKRRVSDRSDRLSRADPQRFLGGFSTNELKQWPKTLAIVIGDTGLAAYFILRSTSSYVSAVHP
jgi:hypothetical protein